MSLLEISLWDHSISESVRNISMGPDHSISESEIFLLFTIPKLKAVELSLAVYADVLFSNDP